MTLYREMRFKKCVSVRGKRRRNTCSHHTVTPTANAMSPSIVTNPLIVPSDCSSVHSDSHMTITDMNTLPIAAACSLRFGESWYHSRQILMTNTLMTAPKMTMFNPKASDMDECCAARTAIQTKVLTTTLDIGNSDWASTYRYSGVSVNTIMENTPSCMCRYMVAHTTIIAKMPVTGIDAPPTIASMSTSDAATPETNPTVTQGRTQPSATASNAPTVQYVRAMQNISPFILRPLPSD